MISKLIPRRRPAFSLLELLVVLAIIAVLIALLLAGVQKVRDAANRTACQNKVKQLILGMQHRHDAYGTLPAGINDPRGPSPMPAAGWPVAVLPFVEQKVIYDEAVAEFQRSRGFRGGGGLPHIGLSRPLPVFHCPSDPRIRDYYYSDPHGLWVAFTSYVGSCGVNCQRPNGLLHLDSKVAFREITDGLSNTILIGERPPSANLYLGWWYAGIGQDNHGSAEMILGIREPFLGKEPNFNTCEKRIYEYTPGSFRNACDSFHFWSPHAGGAWFGFCDGSVRFLKYSANPIMPDLASRAGGEAVAVVD